MGRPKGVPNRTTEAIKEAYTLLLHGNLENLTEWIDRVAEKNPKEAFYMLTQLNEYVIPKLARTESEVTHKGLNPILDRIDALNKQIGKQDVEA